MGHEGNPPSIGGPHWGIINLVFNNIAPSIGACERLDGSYPNAWAVTGPNILWNWKSSWTHRGRRCRGYRDHPDTVLLRGGLAKVIENPDAPLAEIRIVKGGPADKKGIDPTPYLPIERFRGRYDFGIRSGEPINIGAQIY